MGERVHTLLISGPQMETFAQSLTESLPGFSPERAPVGPVSYNLDNTASRA
jgi:hypothetical protein